MTLALLASAIAGLVPLPLAFMIGLAIGAAVNYPDPIAQRDRIGAHAANALPIVLLIFAAGVFTVILDGTGMIDAMGRSLLALMPPEYGPYFGPLVALTSGPFTFVMSNDAYYFGIVPILAETAGHFGVERVEVARAALLGQTSHFLSPLIAVLYLIAGLMKVEVGDLQRFGLPFALVLYLLMVAVAIDRLDPRRRALVRLARAYGAGARVGLRAWRGVPRQAWLDRFLVAALLVRFAVPLVVLGSEAGFRAFLQEDYAAGQATIDASRIEVEARTAPPPVVEKSLAERLKGWIDRGPDVSGRIEELKAIATRAVEHVVRLMVVFVLQTLVAPLLLLWALVGTGRALVARAPPLASPG